MEYIIQSTELISKNYGFISHFLLWGCCILFFLFLRFYLAGAVSDAYRQIKRDMAKKVIGVMMRTDGNKRFSYNYQRHRLDSLGVTYYSNGKITPLLFLTYRVMIPVASFMAGLILNPMWAGILAVALWYLPDVYIKDRNRKDNERMLGSIMSVYDVILLQINSGEYITQVLIDAYRVASYPRLKKALIDLTGDIISSNDLVLSMEVFGSKFDNENIKNLVILVKQLADTGTTPDMLTDIRRRLNTLQESYNRYEQDRVSRLGNACSIAIFAVVMAVIAYTCIAGLAGASEIIV